jgi:hypothetical protein
MLCPAKILGEMRPIPSQPFGGDASVECGGLPPLFAVPACRDVLRD